MPNFFATLVKWIVAFLVIFVLLMAFLFTFYFKKQTNTRAPRSLKYGY